MKSPKEIQAFRVMGKIEGMLANDNLRSGNRLPTERQLSERFQVSRTTVREALHELELKGRIERIRGRGTTVIWGKEEREMSRISLLERYTPQERQIAELMDFRYSIEPVIAHNAALSATPADKYDLRSTADQMEDDPSLTTFRRLDEHFHSLIARSTHNSMFMTLIDISWEALHPTRLIQTLNNPDDRQVSLKAHRDILEALESGHGPKTERAMRRHIAQVAKNIGFPPSRYPNGHHNDDEIRSR